MNDFEVADRAYSWIDDSYSYDPSLDPSDEDNYDDLGYMGDCC